MSLFDGMLIVWKLVPMNGESRRGISLGTKMPEIRKTNELFGWHIQTNMLILPSLQICLCYNTCTKHWDAQFKDG